MNLININISYSLSYILLIKIFKCVLYFLYKYIGASNDDSVIAKRKSFSKWKFYPIYGPLAKYTNKKFLIIYPTKSDYKIIKNNKDIFFALKKLGKVKYFYSTFDLDERFIYGKRKKKHIGINEKLILKDFINFTS